MEGIGLLPGGTVFAREKTRTRVKGEFLTVEGIFSALRGRPLEGYEIHMGKTGGGEAGSLAVIERVGDKPKEDGMNLGNVYGTYVHGIFDGEGIAETILEALLREKGMGTDEMETIDVAAYKEMQYSKLAAGIRESLDMKKIYEILERGV